MKSCMSAADGTAEASTGLTCERMLCWYVMRSSGKAFLYLPMSSSPCCLSAKCVFKCCLKRVALDPFTPHFWLPRPP
jgi:hypothetical protein